MRIEADVRRLLTDLAMRRVATAATADAVEDCFTGQFVGGEDGGEIGLVGAGGEGGVVFGLVRNHRALELGDGLADAFGRYLGRAEGGLEEGGVELSFG